MVLGGLKEGVSPLGWAYAYSTLGNDGDRVSGTLAPQPGDSPVAFTQVTRDGKTIKGGDNDSIHKRVFEQGTAETEKSILETVVSEGTGTAAKTSAEGEWGKTGTTENNGDAWFCGGIQEEVTACVWVGYADTTTPMTTLFNGGPVMGGTYPALIWNQVMTAWEEIKKEHLADKKARERAKVEKENGGKPVEGEGEGEEFESELGEEGGTESEYVPPEGEVEEEVAPETEGGTEATPEGEAEEAPEVEEEVTPEEAAPEVTPEAPAEGGGAGGGVTAG